jgi:hypothetical protein
MVEQTTRKTDKYLFVIIVLERNVATLRKPGFFTLKSQENSGANMVVAWRNRISTVQIKKVTVEILLDIKT